MAFLRKISANRKIPFAVVYSGLQKGLRGNLLPLASEMGREFEEYPNALKKRLIQNVAEDCCDWNIIMRIFNTEPILDELLKFIPEICSHIKCRDATFGFRVAVEYPDNFELPNINDSLLLLLIKEKTWIKNNKINEFGELLAGLINDKFGMKIDFHKVYMFTSKNRSIIDSMVAYLTRDYCHNSPTNIPELPPLSLNVQIPDFVYDKHTGNLAKNRNYDYFLNNMIIAPRMKMTFLESLARDLYIKGNKRTCELLSLNVNCEPTFVYNSQLIQLDINTELVKNDGKNNIIEIIPNNIKLLQTQLITSAHKPKTFYCKFIHLNNTYAFNHYSHVIKYPMLDNDIDKIILSDKVKKILGLISCNIQKIKIGNYYGIIMINYNINIDEKQVIIKSSSIEKDVTIYNGDHLHVEWEDIQKYPLEIFKILAFRYIMGTNDTNNRNILKLNNLKGRCISIDDPVLHVENQYMYKMPVPIKYRNLYDQMLKNNFDKILEWLNKIEIKFTKEFYLKQINKLKQIENWKFY